MTGQTKEFITRQHKYSFQCPDDPGLYKTCKAIKYTCNGAGNPAGDQVNRECNSACHCVANPLYHKTDLYCGPVSKAAKILKKSCEVSYKYRCVGDGKGGLKMINDSPNRKCSEMCSCN